MPNLTVTVAKAGVRSVTTVLGAGLALSVARVVRIIGPTLIGLKGDTGATGLPDGVNTGDLIRYNEVSEEWEAEAEPAEFKGFILTPALASLINAEGAVFYSSTDKAILVCTEV